MRQFEDLKLIRTKENLLDKRQREYDLIMEEREETLRPKKQN